MANQRGAEAEAILDRFVETMFKLMIDHHQKHVVELDLTLPQAQALRMLRRGPLCTGELATVLRISAPAVTQLTNRLTRKHLIERRTGDLDRRSVMVTLTDRGRRAVDTFRERRNMIVSGALSNLGEEDKQLIALALTKIVTALEEYGSEERAQGSVAGRDNESRTADHHVLASNINRAKQGPGGGKMKIEWD